MSLSCFEVMLPPTYWPYGMSCRSPRRASRQVWVMSGVVSCPLWRATLEEASFWDPLDHTTPLLMDGEAGLLSSLLPHYSKRQPRRTL